jgi:hypothetical protein
MQVYESMVDEREVDLLPPTTQSLEDAPCGDTPIESVAMAPGASRSTDATMTDGADLCGDTPADETGTILWRHVAFHVVRSPNQGGANGLSAQITLPQTRGGDRSPKMWVDLLIGLFLNFLTHKALGSLPSFSMTPITCSTFSDISLLWRFMTMFSPRV